jgi:hypothetical protein
MNEAKMKKIIPEIETNNKITVIEEILCLN